MSGTPSNPPPFVSLVMAVRNEAKFIRRTVECLMAQDYPADLLECIVADGMSEDGTPDIIRSLQGSHPNLRVVENPRKTTATGLNTAILAAKGDVIVRMDGHSEIGPDYVRNCVRELERTGADHVGGSAPPAGDNRFGEAVALATTTRFGAGGSSFRYSDREEWVDTVFLGAWTRKVLGRIGLFDESMLCDEDDEFNYRLHGQGGRILLSPLLRATYRPRNSPAGLAKQYFRYGFWKVRVMQKHPRQMRWSHFLPPAFAASLAVTAAWALFSAAGLVLLCAVAVPYITVNLAASVAAAARGGWRYAGLLPLVYGILHLGYGFGFLSGLIRFAGSWNDRRGCVPQLPGS